MLRAPSLRHGQHGRKPATPSPSPPGGLTVRQSKTGAGVRVVDLTPALREELAVWLDKSDFKQPTDLVFPTQVKAIEAANTKLIEFGFEPIDAVSPHGLRRTFASLRGTGIEPVTSGLQSEGNLGSAVVAGGQGRMVRRSTRLHPVRSKSDQSRNAQEAYDPLGADEITDGGHLTRLSAARAAAQSRVRPGPRASTAWWSSSATRRPRELLLRGGGDPRGDSRRSRAPAATSSARPSLDSATFQQRPVTPGQRRAFHAKVGMLVGKSHKREGGFRRSGADESQDLRVTIESASTEPRRTAPADRFRLMVGFR
jgi:hypothetical protein